MRWGICERVLPRQNSGKGVLLGFIPVSIETWHDPQTKESLPIYPNNGIASVPGC